MRFASVLTALLIVAGARAQTDSQSLFNTVVPDVTIHVHKHSTGADMVEITMRADGYPPALLRSQIGQLAQYLKSPPRGVDIGQYAPDPSRPEMKFTKAAFAVDGVIDRTKGTLKINPFAQAMAGAPNPWKISGIELEFEGEVPSSEMPRKWSSKFCPGEGRFEGEKDARLTGIEYRIKLLSQDPTKFDIPEPGQKPKQEDKKVASEGGLDWTLILVFLVAAGAVGALVYSLLLRVRPKVSK